MNKILFFLLAAVILEINASNIKHKLNSKRDVKDDKEHGKGDINRNEVVEPDASKNEDSKNKTDAEKNKDSKDKTDAEINEDSKNKTDAEKNKDSGNKTNEIDPKPKNPSVSVLIGNYIRDIYSWAKFIYDNTVNVYNHLFKRNREKRSAEVSLFRDVKKFKRSVLDLVQEQTKYLSYAKDKISTFSGVLQSTAAPRQDESTVCYLSRLASLVIGFLENPAWADNAYVKGILPYFQGIKYILPCYV